MCIVTISRGSYSGAKAVAEGVAETLGAPCVSREVITEAAKNAGLSADALTEVLARPPGFFERHSRERDAYMRFVEAALYQRAAQGSFVYHGHGGQFMLAGIPNLLRVRVVAPMGFRIDAVQAALGLDRRQAERHIATMDRQRATWVRYLYGVAWDDPQFYDVVINLERVDVETAVRGIARLARSPRFAATKSRLQQIANEALVHSVTAELTKLPEAHGAGLRIQAVGGTVVLRGTTQYDDLRRSIVDVVKSVPGVDDVRCEIDLRSDALWT